MISQNMLYAVQKTESEILQQIDKICRAHNLTYFGIGGTALGAVRHQGFIPWDDDIDIGMPRKDYEAFLKFASEELPKAFFVQNFHTEKNSPFYFTKIRKNDTKFVEFYLRDHQMHHGIFVDIFPFDNVPVNKTLCNLHFRFCRFLYHLYLCKSLSTTFSSRYGNKAKHKPIIRRLLHVLLTPVPKAWLFHMLDRSVQMFNNKACKEISHIVRRRLRVYLDDLYPITYLPFEDYEMPVPCNYQGYLSAQFGDYTNLPPEGKRYGHLPYLIEFDSMENSK